MNMTFAGIIGLLVFMFISRGINEKALKKLDDHQKAGLMERMSGLRFWNLGILIGMIALYFVLTRVIPNIGLNITFIYFGFLFIYILVLIIFSYRIMKKLDLPQDYMRANILSQGLQLLGLILFIVLFIYQMMMQNKP